MCEKNDLDLSLNGETFSSLKADFVTILKRTLGNMTMKGADEATITIKLGVSLQKTSVPVVGSLPRAVTKPTFKHDISSVMQVKDKMSGQFAGNMELVWDDESGEYILRPISDGQTSMFDQPEEDGQEDDDLEEVNELPQANYPALMPAGGSTGEEETDEYEYDDPE